jgi:protease I
MIVAPTDFRDEELAQPKAVFEQAGALVTVASKGVKEATGMFGARAAIDRDSSELSATDYDAVVFIGGAGASVYFDDRQIQALAKDVYDQGKLVAAICIAPSTLANAGILAGKKATAFSSEVGNLQAKGAVYSQEPVVVDGKIVTASGPAASEAFGQKIVELLNLE